MSQALQHFGIKLIAGDGFHPEAEQLIPIFHRWIQESAVPGMLVDVTDYSHVPAGPGVILIAHEGFYSVDHRANRTGFLYLQRTALDGTTESNLLHAWRCAQTGAAQLQKDLGSDATFRDDEVELFVNDRALAPNTAETLDRVGPELKRFFESAWGRPVTLERDSDDPRTLFRVRVKPAA
jgi:hypothetical protein